jgi:hypothetical protein
MHDHGSGRSTKGCVIVTGCDTLSSHVINIPGQKMIYLFLELRGVQRNGEGVSVVPWESIPPPGGIDSHVATRRQIVCTEQALNY